MVLRYPDIRELAEELKEAIIISNLLTGTSINEKNKKVHVYNWKKGDYGVYSFFAKAEIPFNEKSREKGLERLLINVKFEDKYNEYNFWSVENMGLVYKGNDYEVNYDSYPYLFLVGLTKEKVRDIFVEPLKTFKKEHDLW